MCSCGGKKFSLEAIFIISSLRLILNEARLTSLSAFYEHYTLIKLSFLI